MSEPSAALVSIVIPVFNGANHLAGAIDSALAQRWPAVEVIVVDDGSTDDGETARVAAAYGDRIRYLHKPNGGVSSALNLGIRAMRGRYFSWLSHDDEYAVDKLARQVPALEAQGGGMVFSDYELLDEDSGSVRRVEVGGQYDPGAGALFVFDMVITGCALLVDRRCFEAVGAFDVGLPGSQDMDLWHRISQRFAVTHLPGVVVRYRQHAGQGSRSRRHLDETALLWAATVDRVVAEDLPADPDHRLALFTRFGQSVAGVGYASLRQQLDRLVAADLAGTRLAVVLDGEADLARLAAIADLVHRRGLVLATLVAGKPPNQALRHLDITTDDGQCFAVELVERPVGTDATVLLAHLHRQGGDEPVWLIDGQCPLAHFPVATALSRLRRPGVAAIAPRPAATTDPDGALGPLSGLLFQRGALSAALAEAAPRLSSLLLWLVRQGEVEVLPVSGLDAVRTGDADPVGRAAGARTDAAPTGARLGLALCRRPAALALAWRILRTVHPAPRRALNRWLGLDGLFDADWYLRAYPDVDAAGIDPLYHYLVFGVAESRDPGPGFSTRDYLAEYPQVGRQRLQPLLHYRVFGAPQGCRVAPSPIGAEPPPRADRRPALLVVTDGESASRRALRCLLADLEGQLANHLRLVYLVARGDGSIRLGTDVLGEHGMVIHPLTEYQRLDACLRALNVRRLLVGGCRGFNGELSPLLERLALPFDLLLVDPLLVEAGAGGQPPGSDEEDDEDAAPGQAPSGVGRDLDWLVRHARGLLAPSASLARRVARAAPAEKIHVLPPPDPSRLRRFRPWMRPWSPGQPVRVAWFGKRNAARGGATFDAVLTAVRETGQPLTFIVFDDTDTERPAGPVTFVHADSDAQRVQAVITHAPHLAWFPYLAPAHADRELTDAEMTGLPIVASACGEIPERLHDRRLTWLQPVDTDADTWIRLLLDAARQGQAHPMPTDDRADYDRLDAGAMAGYLRRVIDA